MSKKKGFKGRCNARERHSSSKTTSAAFEIHAIEDVVMVPRIEYDALQYELARTEIARRMLLEENDVYMNTTAIKQVLDVPVKE